MAKKKNITVGSIIEEGIKELEKAQKSATGFMRHFRTKAQQQAALDKIEEKMENLRQKRDEYALKSEERDAITAYLSKPFEISNKIEQQRNGIIQEIAEAFNKDKSDEVMNEIRNRREQADQEVARLSKFPARLFSSPAAKIQAMYELMLAQAAEHAAIETLSAIKTGDVQLAQSIEASKRDLTFIYDGYKMDSLFTKNELEFPEVVKLKNITQNSFNAHQKRSEKIATRGIQKPSSEEPLAPEIETRAAPALPPVPSPPSGETAPPPPGETAAQKEQRLLETYLAAQKEYNKVRVWVLSPANNEKAKQKLTQAKTELDTFNKELLKKDWGPSVDSILRGEPLKFPMGHGRMINMDSAKGSASNKYVVDIPDNFDKKHLDVLEPYLIQQRGVKYLELDFNNKSIALPLPNKGKHTGRKEKALAEAYYALYEATKPPRPEPITHALQNKHDAQKGKPLQIKDVKLREDPLATPPKPPKLKP